LAKDYWFARRFTYDHPRASMAPVTREGWMVVWAFIACILLGGILFGLCMFAGMPVIGIVLFVLFAFAGGAGFILLANLKGDPERTVAEYRSAARPSPAKPT
jgi:predicted branched-subunit amino acid permease